MIRTFINFRKQEVILSEDAYTHVKEMHSEVTLDQIEEALLVPDEVRQSSYRGDTELYYLRRTKQRFTCVIVKVCKDGNFISTALTTTKHKDGKVIYRKGE